MKKTLIFIIILFLFFTSFSAEFEVVSFSNDPLDSSAVKFPRMDAQGLQCALIKVKTNIKGLVFSANDEITGDVEFKDDMYRIYISPGEILIDISRNGFESLSYVFEEEIESGCVYLLILEAKNNSSVSKQENSVSADLLPKPYKNQSSCSEFITDSRDKKKYKIVKIGEQCWMSENLNYKSDFSFCYVNNAKNCDKYGRLYTWEVMMNNEAGNNDIPGNSQGICPEGWHIPTDEEWIMLEAFVDSLYEFSYPIWREKGLRGYDAGILLKSKSSWPRKNAGTDLYDFNSMPTGYMNFSVFRNLGKMAFYWTATEINKRKAWCRIHHDNKGMARKNISKDYGCSVRCVRN